MASRTTDAARQVFTGEGVARCAAFHERRTQERDALADRPIDANDLLPDGVEWVAAGSIVVDADAPNYRPLPTRESVKERRKQRREDAEAVLQPANAVPCLAHGANGARGRGRWVAGTLADRQWRAEAGHAMAERAVAAGMGPEAARKVLGRHVDARNGPARTVKVGLYRV